MFNKPRLLTPGPTPLPERVRLALAQDMIHHRKPGFKKILLETETMLRSCSAPNSRCSRFPAPAPGP